MMYIYAYPSMLGFVLSLQPRPFFQDPTSWIKINEFNILSQPVPFIKSTWGPQVEVDSYICSYIYARLHDQTKNYSDMKFSTKTPHQRIQKNRKSDPNGRQNKRNMSKSYELAMCSCLNPHTFCD